MENKPDMRISKTLRSINNAFMELIIKKPVHKITVTELAQKAEISKGTFYLHYLDIYDLYNKLVKDTILSAHSCFRKLSRLVKPCQQGNVRYFWRGI